MSVISSFSILIEGLDGTGKTTIVEALKNKIGELSSVESVVTLKTHLDSIKDIRDFCVNQNPHLREGYYMTGNYLASVEIQKLLDSDTTVIIDRFYPTT